MHFQPAALLALLALSTTTVALPAAEPALELPVAHTLIFNATVAGRSMMASAGVPPGWPCAPVYGKEGTVYGGSTIGTQGCSMNKWDVVIQAAMVETSFSFSRE